MEKKNKGAEDDFLAGLDDTKETDALGLSVESEELFPEEKEEKKEGAIEIEEKTEKPIPFYKDEKIQRYIEKQVDKRIKDFKPSTEQTFRKEVGESDDKIVSALTRLVGNDTDEKRAVLADLKSALDERDDRASQKAYERLQHMQNEEREQEKQELEEAESELEEGFEEIETSFGVDLTSGTAQANRLQNAYREFLQSIEPKGGYQEYPDFSRTFELFKNSVQKRSNATAKVLASRGMERSTASTTEKPKGTSWADVDKMLNSN